MTTVNEEARNNQFQGDIGTYEHNATDLYDMLTDRFKKGVEFAQRMIPVEEELPELNTQVLLVNANGDYYIGAMEKNSKTFRDTIYGNKVHFVTHWRPINRE